MSFNFFWEKKKYKKTIKKKYRTRVASLSSKRREKKPIIRGFHEQTLNFSVTLRLPIKEYSYYLWKWKFAWPQNWYQEKIQHFRLNINKFLPEKWSEWTWTFFRKKKNTAVFFFFAFWEKIKYNFLQIWVSEWPSTFPGKKKYGTFGTCYLKWL